MPDVPVTKFTVEAVDWSDIAYQMAHGVLKLFTEVNGADGVVAALVKKEGAAWTMFLHLATELAIELGKVMHDLEQPMLPLIAGFVGPSIQGLFGAEVNQSAFAKRLSAGDGHAAARAIVDGFMKAIEGSAPGELAPGPEGSARVATAAVTASLESTFNAIVPELLSDMLGEFGPRFRELTELPENIIGSLGVSRLVRRAIGPLVTVCAATPMQWHVNKKYTPTLLSPAAAVQQILRDPSKADQWKEDLRRQGYSEQRIAVLLRQGGKFFSPADVRTFVSREFWTGETALQHLQNQGYDKETASAALRLEGLRRFEELEGQEAGLIIGAYGNRDIDRPAFLRLLKSHVAPSTEQALYTEIGDLRRALNIRRLSLAQVESMVKVGVANFVDFRAAAERDGYPPEDVALLELQLRAELDKQKTLDEHRAEQEAERVAAAAARAAALAARKADVEQQRALARRGSEADLERAAVRGKIPIARLEEVYAAHYDGDTIQALVSLVEDDRQAYLDRQAALEAARARNTGKALDTGALEQAFLRNLLTVEELRGRFGSAGYDAGDADLLVATMVDKKADADALAKKRAAADKAATTKQIDLGRFERLVRRGARTMAQYVTLLQSLHVDEAAIPDFVDALQLLIADDAAARDERIKAAAGPPPKGLTLEQMHRAVLLGTKTVDDFSAYLITNRFTSDAQTVLRAALEADVADAAAARQRREAPAPAAATPGSPLSTIRRAAQLGLIPPDVYLARLQAAGYSDDDLAIELDLLLTEIADVQATRRQRDTPPNSAPPAGLTLAALERAVKAGAASVGDYRARAVELGYQSADIDTLVAVVEREQQTLAAARKAHDDWGLRLAAGGDGIATLDAAVKDGSLEIVDYVAALEGLGVPDDEAQLVGAFMAFTVGG